MNTKKIIISVFIWMSVMQFCPDAAGQQQRGLLEVYLPRQIKTSGETITIADVGVISGDESMASAAGKIVLGRFAKPGQQIVIEASTLLSRLASRARTWWPSTAVPILTSTVYDMCPNGQRLVSAVKRCWR